MTLTKGRGGRKPLFANRGVSALHCLTYHIVNHFLPLDRLLSEHSSGPIFQDFILKEKSIIRDKDIASAFPGYMTHVVIL